METVPVIGRAPGAVKPVYVIAEAGVNHNGDVELARTLIDVARRAGADAVKFQMFDPDEIVTTSASKAEYQRAAESDIETQRELLRRLALKREEFADLASYARSKDIDFVVTPFDADSAVFTASLGVRVIKIASGEITNIPFLAKVASLQIPVILSTGMATMGEIEEALDIFLSRAIPTSLLHCVSAYPAPFQELNLRVIQTLQSAYGVPVGFSDHTPGIEASIGAVALGAEIVEKHFTVDRTLPGPDHKASLEPDELAMFVRAIRNVSVALGSRQKHVQKCERDVIVAARRSVVTARDLKAGEVITHKDIALMRPAIGIAPKFAAMVVGRIVKTDVNAHTPISWDMLK